MRRMIEPTFRATLWIGLGLCAACGTTPALPVDIAGPWAGVIRSSRFTDSGADLLLTQAGPRAVGSWAMRGGAVGSFDATVTGATVRFTLTQTTPSCPGTFTGTGTVVLRTMTVTFNGTDCQGAITGGTGTFTRPDPATSLTGTAIDTYLALDTEIGLSRDLTGALEVLVPDGQGGFSRPTVQASPLGTFRVDGIPAGATAYLKIDRAYFVTTARDIDLGSSHLGRPGVATAAEGSSLILSVDQMSAWQSGDDLELVSLDTGTAASVLTFNSPVTAGATALSGLEVDWSGGEVIDSQLGDHATLVHLVARSSDGGQGYVAAAQTAALGDFTIESGNAARATGTFTDVSRTLNAQLELRTSVFETNRRAVFPSAETAAQFFFLVTLPQASQRGFYSSAPTLLLLDAGSGTRDVMTGTVTFGNPFPAEWPIIGALQAQYSVSFEFPGASRPLRMSATTTHVDSVESLVAGPVAPLVGPASAPLVNGQDATSDRAGVGQSPTLSWTAPSSGTAHFYVVTVTKLLPTGGFGQRRQVVATLLTTATSVVIPPDVLEAGQYYTFTIASRHARGIDAARTPLRRALPYSSVEILTAVVTP